MGLKLYLTLSIMTDGFNSVDFANSIWGQYCQNIHWLDNVLTLLIRHDSLTIIISWDYYFWNCEPFASQFKEKKYVVGTIYWVTRSNKVNSDNEIIIYGVKWSFNLWTYLCRNSFKIYTKLKDSSFVVAFFSLNERMLIPWLKSKSFHYCVISLLCELFCAGQHNIAWLRISTC